MGDSDVDLKERVVRVEVELKAHCENADEKFDEIWRRIDELFNRFWAISLSLIAALVLALAFLADKLHMFK
ncbi:hypothetical protein WCLP8_1880008 [uncultured Gammaproteobacteria bacterium]